MFRTLSVIIAALSLGMLFLGSGNESSPVVSYSSTGRAEMTGFLRSSSGSTAMEITYQNVFIREEHLKRLTKNMDELAALLKPDYYGDPDGRLFSVSDIPATSRIDCSIAVSFTGFSYSCIKGGVELRESSTTAEVAVTNMRDFLHRISV